MQKDDTRKPEVTHDESHDDAWRQIMDAELRKTIGKQLTNLPDMPELAHAVIQPKDYPL